MARRPRSAAGTTSSLADGLVAATSGSRPATAEPSRSSMTGTLVVRAGDRVASARVEPGRSSEEIARELNESLAKEPPKKEAPPLFASANLGSGVSADFARITETLFAADVLRDYDDLEKHLEVGEHRNDYHTLTEHLDKAEQRARRAHALYLGAKIELVRWEADARVVNAAMREKARLQLEDEKAEGTRRKVLGKEDVEDRVADLYPDEWKAQQVAKAKMRATVEHLERLADLWKTKCYSLSTLLSNLRK